MMLSLLQSSTTQVENSHKNVVEKASTAHVCNIKNNFQGCTQLDAC